MKRSASLDLLRGGAAFAVAIPHYLTLNAPFQPFAEASAIAGVEVFFVLSGFVLAPQIVDWVVGQPWRNLGVFLARRWMRTIPPYVVALVVIALMTGNLMTADFVRYLFYVENLFVSANHIDFYPVAWSLAVEEWFYVLFAPALFVVALLLKRRDRRLEATFAILVILVVAALRFTFAPHDWDLNVRRVTLFRINSIVWGFLLYLALERFSPLALDAAAGRRRLGALIALLALSIPVELAVAIFAVDGDPSAQQAFPFASAAFGMICVGVFRQAEEAFRGRFVRGLSFYLGRISYSVYLFHLIIVMALKPRIASAPLALQLAIYVALILALSTIFFAGFERPILVARPYYGAARRAAAATVLAPRGAARRFRPSLLSVALALAALGAGVLARNAFMANRPYAFYALLIATAGLALALSERARPASTGALAAAARAFLLFALALPFADALYRHSTGLPLAATVAQPTYSYRAAHANPAAFAVWWYYYLNEWIRDDGIRSKIDAPDPLREAAVRPCSGLLRTHVRHHDPDQQSRLSRAGPHARQGRRFPHFRPRRVADLRPHFARRRAPMAGTAAGSVRPACRLRPQSRGRQRRDRGLYARRQPRAHAPRHPAAQARPDPERARHERAARARPQARAGAQRAGREAARLGAPRPRRADDRARRPRLAEPEFGRGAAQRRSRRCPTPN